MRILVIGGTRFIGPYVVRHLVENGHEVTVSHRGQTQAQLPPQVQHLYGDRYDLPARRDEIARLAPDAAIDMFAFTEADARATVAGLTGLAGRMPVISCDALYAAFGRLITIVSVTPEHGLLTD